MTEETFDAAAFCAWLDEFEGSVPKNTLIEQWPHFPFAEMAYQTCPYIDGEICYYQHDLRRIAEGRGVID